MKSNFLYYSPGRSSVTFGRFVNMQTNKQCLHCTAWNLLFFFHCRTLRFIAVLGQWFKQNKKEEVSRMREVGTLTKRANYF